MFKLTSHDIELLCEAGSMAPSGGNAQPWRVSIENNIFEIKLDSKRSNSFLDVRKFASFFAIGCFTENVSIAAEHLNLRYSIEFPEFKSIQDTLVRFIFIGRNDKNKNNLYAFIRKRVSNRQLYDGTTLSDKEIKELQNSIGNIGKNFLFKTISEYEKKVLIAKTLGIADRIRTLHDGLFYQMMSEFRWNEEENQKTKDGLDLKTLELPPNFDKIFLLLRTFPPVRKIIPRKAFEDLAKPLLLNCSHLACLASSKQLNHRTLIDGGRAMERLWLTATKMGIALQPWSVSTFLMMRVEYFHGKELTIEQVSELKNMASQLRTQFGISQKEYPILIFRLSKAKAPSARSLRIPWQQFTEIKNN